MAAHFYTGLQQIKELLDSGDESKIEHFNKVLLPGLVNSDTWASDSWEFWNVLYRYQGKFITLDELKHKLTITLKSAEYAWVELGKPQTREEWRESEDYLLERNKVK